MSAGVAEAGESVAGLLEKLTLFGMSLGVVVGVGLLIWVVHRRLLKFYSDRPAQQHYRQLIMICVWLFAILLVVLIMPLGDQMRGQLLGFLGILLSATIALSSTTIVGNAMAGLMLRSLRNCHVGDYIRIGDDFGRISNMDLLHVEIQTEDRDLTTLPNLYIVTNPMTVLRNSGTVLHVEVSLGYDISRKQIEAALLEAAQRAELENPFVQITSLGDFSVTYRVSGLLTDIDKLLATRRKLRAYTLDTLHEAGIEIVSPNVMLTRPLAQESRLVPAADGQAEPEGDHPAPDELVFDKAQQAEELHELKQSYTDMSQRLLEIEQELKDAGQGEDRRPLNLEKKKLEAAMARAAKQIEAAEAALGGKDDKKK